MSTSLPVTLVRLLAVAMAALDQKVDYITGSLGREKATSRRLT